MSGSPTPERRRPLAPGSLRRPALVAAALFLAAAVLAGALSLLVWSLAPSRLDVVTDVVGYPIHSNFDPYRYFWAYGLALGVFPLLTVGVFLVLARLRPGLRDSLRWAPTRSGPEARLSGRALSATALVRAAFIGSVLGLEAAVAVRSASRSLVGVALPVALAYLALAAGAAWGSARRGRRRSSFPARLDLLNALGATVTVLWLYAVSRATQVAVAADASVKQFPWLPLWLALLLTVGVAAWTISALRRDPPAEVAERLSVLVAAPVLLFLLTAVLPGTLGPIDTFHEGEWLAAADLVRDGAFPWRDTLFIHGLFGDVGFPLPGFLVFEDSRWGGVAGASMLLNPASWLALYYLAAYLVRRHWVILGLLVTAIALGALHVAPLVRAGLLPVAILLLVALLRRATVARGVAFTLVALVQAIGAPEVTLVVAALFLAVLASELHGYRRGRPVRAAFERTIVCVVAGAGFLALWAVFLASRGALDDFVFYYRTFAPDHELTGALPLSASGGKEFWLAAAGAAAAAPPAAVIAAVWYLAARLWLRRPIDPDEWAMAGTALGVALYYQKFVSRADVHAYHMYAVALPLLVYVVYRLALTGESLLRRSRLAERAGPLGPSAAIGAIGLLVVLVAAPISPADALRAVPRHFRTAAIEVPSVERLGYAVPQAVDAAMVSDLGAVLDGYLGPGDTLFDFTNNPAIFHYLVERPPATRYYHVSMAIREASQRDLLRELDRERPRLVVFGSQSLGFHTWDLIPNQVRHYDISAHLLREYRPLIFSRGFLFFGRRDETFPAVETVASRLAEPPATDDLYFRLPFCDWGYSPNFLKASVEAEAEGEPVDLPLVQRGGSVRVSGWAVDPAAGAPATEIVAVLDGRTVARSRPTIERPDIAAGLANPALLESGFTLLVPTTAVGDPPGPDRLRIFAVSAASQATELAYGPDAGWSPPSDVPAPAQIDLGAGRTAPVVAGTPPGFVDTSAVHERAYELRLPPGARPDAFDWLEVELGGRTGAASFVVSDEIGTAAREIGFKATAGGPASIRVPVSSCGQWRGYSGGSLSLLADQAEVRAVRLFDGD